MADLTAAERQQITDYLSHPLLFPADFKNWIADYVTTNIPKISVKQIFGFELWSIKSASPAEGSVSVTSTSYAEQGGPILSNLANGFYVAIWGGNCGQFNTSAETVSLGLSIDGATPTIDAISTAGAFGTAALLDLTTGDGGHSLNILYKRGSVNKTVDHRWLHALKVVT